MSAAERDAILVIKLGALGDVMMATPLLRAIVDRHAGAPVWLLTTPAFAPLFAGWDRLRVHAFDRRSTRALLGTIRWVRRLRPARVYDLQGNDRSAVLTALSGAPVRIGNHARFPYTHHPAAPWRGQTHIFERMLEVLAAAGVDVVDRAPVLPAGPRTREQVTRWLATHGLSQAPLALLHAGASPARPEKCWPHFDRLAVMLEQGGLRVIWLGAGADSALNARLALAAGIDATGAFDIPALAELARHARFAVTNDSGPMHAVSAAGIPVFGLFGPSDWRRTHALGQRAHVITNAGDCAACRERRYGREDASGHTCLAALAPDAVLARLRAAALVPA